MTMEYIQATHKIIGPHMGHTINEDELEAVRAMMASLLWISK